MSDTRERLRETLESTARTLEVVWHAAHNGRDAGHGLASGCDECLEFFGEWGDDADPWEELRELPLEVVWEPGEPYAVVLSTGGPHVEIRGGTRHDGPGYALYGYWGGEEMRLVPQGDAVELTGEWFRDLA